jgi:hypothetical protein
MENLDQKTLYAGNIYNVLNTKFIKVKIKVFDRLRLTLHIEIGSFAK